MDAANSFDFLLEEGEVWQEPHLRVTASVDGVPPGLQTLVAAMVAVTEGSSPLLYNSIGPSSILSRADTKSKLKAALQFLQLDREDVYFQTFGREREWPSMQSGECHYWSALETWYSLSPPLVASAHEGLPEVKLSLLLALTPFLKMYIHIDPSKHAGFDEFISSNWDPETKRTCQSVSVFRRPVAEQQAIERCLQVDLGLPSAKLLQLCPGYTDVVSHLTIMEQAYTWQPGPKTRIAYVQAASYPLAHGQARGSG